MIDWFERELICCGFDVVLLYCLDLENQNYVCKLFFTSQKIDLHLKKLRTLRIDFETNKQFKVSLKNAGSIYHGFNISNFNVTSSFPITYKLYFNFTFRKLILNCDEVSTKVWNRGDEKFISYGNLEILK